MKLAMTGCALIAAAAPSALLAGGLTFSGHIAATSNYIQDGVSASDGRPALQPFFEIGKDSFYGNLWASNIKDEAGNTAALDLSMGYRGDGPAALSYDLGYTQHLFNKTHGYDAEIDAGLDDQVTLSGELAYDLAAHRLGETLGVAYELDDHWSLNGEASKPDPATAVIFGAGVGYALDDKMQLDLQLRGSAETETLSALTLTYGFGAGEK